jgi:hypothetical protein
VRHPVVRVELAKQGEPGLRAVHHGKGDRAAEVTTGPGATWESTSSSARICGQSVSLPAGASSCTAAIAACSW